MRRLFFLAALSIVVVLLVPQLTTAQSRIRVQQTCHAEVKWNHLTKLRRGPGTGFGSHRELRWDNAQMRVFGQNAVGDWFQVELAEPPMLGWVWKDNINLFGKCDNLPVTEDNPEPERAPATPRSVDLPEFAANLDFDELDQVWQLNDGMLYLRRSTESPLMQLHMVIADLNNPGVDVRVHVGAVPNTNAALVSEMVTEAGAFVAINGDFYSGNYMPQGLTVIDGDVVVAPKFRATFALTEDKQPFIGYFTRGWTWAASVTAENGAVIPLQLMNSACDPRWLCIFSDHIRGLPNRTGFDGLRVLLSPDYDVLSVEKANGYFEVPDDHFVLVAGEFTTTGEWIMENLDVGDKISINLNTEPNWRDFEYAISGGPIIVTEGKWRQDCDPELPEEERECEEFDELFRLSHYFNNNIPRTAVGINSKENLLYLVMVEGYEVDHSNGITQRRLAEFFMEFDADFAMEMDGGGSSGMWIGPTFVSDYPIRGERRVSNALMLFWKQ